VYFLTDRETTEMCNIMYKAAILTGDMDAMAKKMKGLCTENCFL